jgi:hypothetical protein
MQEGVRRVVVKREMRKGVGKVYICCILMCHPDNYKNRSIFEFKIEFISGLIAISTLHRAINYKFSCIFEY